MKFSKKRLKEIIKEEWIKEFISSRSAMGGRKNPKDIRADYTKAQADKTEKTGDYSKAASDWLSWRASNPNPGETTTKTVYGDPIQQYQVDTQASDHWAGGKTGNVYSAPSSAAQRTLSQLRSKIKTAKDSGATAAIRTKAGQTLSAFDTSVGYTPAVQAQPEVQAKPAVQYKAAVPAQPEQKAVAAVAAKPAEYKPAEPKYYKAGDTYYRPDRMDKIGQKQTYSKATLPTIKNPKTGEVKTDYSPRKMTDISGWGREVMDYTNYTKSPGYKRADTEQGDFQNWRKSRGPQEPIDYTADFEKETKAATKGLKIDSPEYEKAVINVWKPQSADQEQAYEKWMKTDKGGPYKSKLDPIKNWRKSLGKQDDPILVKPAVKAVKAVPYKAAVPAQPEVKAQPAVQYKAAVQAQPEKFTNQDIPWWFRSATGTGQATAQAEFTPSSQETIPNPDYEPWSKQDKDFEQKALSAEDDFQKARDDEAAKEQDFIKQWEPVAKEKTGKDAPDISGKRALFGLGGNIGGRGKGGAKSGGLKGKGKGKGKGKKGKKGKKDESLFKILGRDLMNEIKNLEKFSKKKKYSRRKKNGN